MNTLIEEKIDEINQVIRKYFHDATSVNIFFNYAGIKIDAKYKTNNKDVSVLNTSYFMPNLDNIWIKEFK